ncbi:hypothetical protein [Piscinibacter gummiphilus]|uniref:DUF4158 domain-containing protein n=1 Tax=Piscinibacter gummiphilus TaxID=946333 RepID=A0ABZ0CWW5_9BURK|nr:hypothetical protein [Piscinibacter gummiphilus]WOB06959.1 hypothetical protein RXV79_18775 [Piscinibacter gummiphilus]
MSTLFFHESEFEGNACRISVANYLAFLSLRGPELAIEVAKIRQALAAPSRKHLERDISLLLRARNWRFHNIACVAIACTEASSQLLEELWSCIKRGSWTSPQLAATAEMVDKDFGRRAVHLIEDQATYFKSIVALAALLEARHSTESQLSAAARSNLDEAKTIDRDNSGSIATAWNGNLRAAFGAA